MHSTPPVPGTEDEQKQCVLVLLLVTSMDPEPAQKLSKNPASTYTILGTTHHTTHGSPSIGARVGTVRTWYWQATDVLRTLLNKTNLRH